MADMHIIPIGPLRAAVRYLVSGFGSDAREIELVTENLIQANLTGHDSHGVGMLPRYAEAYLEGSLKPNAKIQTRMDSGTMIGLDGECGFGQAIGHQAMELAIARAKEYGSCIVALGNSHHLCRIGAWAEMTVAQGLISIHFVNVISRPIVAPFGGGDARFGTNPFTVGIPVAGLPSESPQTPISRAVWPSVRAAHTGGALAVHSPLRIGPPLSTKASQKI